MSYSIVSIDSQQYIFVSHIGTIYRRELDEAWRGALGELQEKNWHRFLVDIRAMMNFIPASEMYDFISCLRESLPKKIVIALIVRSDQRGDGRFIENVARNRGINLQHFFNMQPALSWLTREEKTLLQAKK
jgi:hypothetical protein